MCGICGVISFRGPEELPDDRLLDRMTDSLAHRGPDDRGTWRDGDVALGHRRLAVIDLSRAGRQPMANEDGSVQIVYNGEVYNFRELALRHGLVSKGHVFRSRTDTEVLLHLYEELGLDMVPQLNGMFAIAIWDARTRSLHLIRDRFGIKPLFWQRDDRCFRFASEIKAILTDPRVARRPSLEALHDYLTFDYIPGPQTAFEGIFEVPPAHHLTVGADGQTRLARWWDLPHTVDDSCEEPDVIRTAAELLDRSVRRRLIADVPIGVMLSGGLDSSALVAVMSRHTSEPIHTYSVGFEDPSFDELPAARVVATQYETVAREIVVTPQLVRELLPRYLTYIDEPYADGSAIPTYYVCRLAKGEVVVVLSGEGGDEAMAGYDTYAAYQAARWGRRIPGWLRRGVLAPLANLLPVSDRKLSFEFKVKRFLAGLDLDPLEAHLWWRIVLTEVQKLELYPPALRERFAPQPSIRHFRDAAARAAGRNGLATLMYVDASVFLPDDLMIKNDRMSMAHSLEARVPFTDYELVEFMARVPARLKLPGLRKKHILRQAMRELLPRRIVNKKKVGLEMPYSAWLRNELRDLLMDYCSRERLERSGLFMAAPVHARIEEHLQRRRDHGRFLWGLLNYMMWHDLYIAR